MDALEFLSERQRMCNYYRNMDSPNSCGSKGNKCPLFRLWDKDEKGNRYTCNSQFLSASCFDIQIKLVESWSEEHPIKTFKQDFLEKFPNAATRVFEDYCPSAFGYCGDNVCAYCSNKSKPISYCWDSVMDCK